MRRFFACFLLQVIFARHAHVDRQLGLLSVAVLAGDRLPVIAVVLLQQRPHPGRWGFLVFRLASPQQDRNDVSELRPLQIRKHRNAVKPLVQQQIADFDAPPANELHQFLDDLFHAGAGFDRHQRHRVAVAFVDHRRRGVGVEVAGSRFGFAAKDLLDVERRLAVVGNQRQIDGQDARLSQQRLGQLVTQAAIQSLLQLPDVRQGGQQYVVDAARAGSVGQILTRGKDRNHASGGDQKNPKQHRCRTFASLVVQPQRRAQPVFRIPIDLVLRNDIVRP